MKRKNLSFAIMAFAIAIAGCTKDNYKQPTSVIKGRVVYQGQPVGVRSNGVQLELWQHGFQLFSKIPVYVDQDGSFSASVFDGDYKLVQLKGNGPWVDKTDSIDVQVRGESVIDVPVTPYFTITNETFTKSGTTITGTGKVTKISTNAIERVTLYIGTTAIVDANNNSTKLDKTGTAVADLTQPLSFNLTLPANLSSRDFVFVRLGVKTAGIGEMAYTKAQQLQLK